ncbi:MAG: hypothetical protein RLZZ67_595 [Candidatus Parcubacteria bacterium]|jgi:hypothetical protein
MKKKKYAVVALYFLLTIVFPLVNNFREIGGLHWNQDRLIFTLAIIMPLFISLTAFFYVKKSIEPKWSMLLIILMVALSYSKSNSTERVNLGLFITPFFDIDKADTIYNVFLPLGAVYYLIFGRERSAKLSEIRN